MGAGLHAGSVCDRRGGRSPPTFLQRILLDHGIEPAPEREKRMSWETSLEAHLGRIAAADFFPSKCSVLDARRALRQTPLPG